MPEIKHTFTAGKMNKDLDERLVKNGEYRHAQNVQVRTTDGDAAGLVQNIQGNTLIGSTYIEPWMNQLTPNVTIVENGQQTVIPGQSNMVKCVASIADEKNDKGYFFFAAPEFPPKVEGNDGSRRVYMDTILEQDANGDVVPVVVDKFGVFDLIENVVVNFSGQGSATNPLVASGWSEIPVYNSADYRPGMEISFYNQVGNSLLTEPLKIKAIDGNTLLLTEPQFTLVDPADSVWIKFEAEKVLNFSKSRSISPQHNFITSVNVIDNFLMWTDNITEPKKINITRCKTGTQSINNHTRLYVDNPSTGNLSLIGNITEVLDNSSSEPFETNGYNYIKEEHITVIKKAPTAAPTLHMKSTDREGFTEVTINNFQFINNTDQLNANLYVGTTKQINNNVFLSTKYKSNDILLFTDTVSGVVIKVKFVCYEDSNNNEVLGVTSRI